MPQLNPDQVNELLIAHCNRVIENMNHDDLLAYALDKMMESFDKDPGVGNTDQSMLISAIINAEGGDKDDAAEFICGVGVEGDVADKLVEGV